MSLLLIRRTPLQDLLYIYIASFVHPCTSIYLRKDVRNSRHTTHPLWVCLLTIISLFYFHYLLYIIQSPWPITLSQYIFVVWPLMRKAVSILRSLLIGPSEHNHCSWAWACLNKVSKKQVSGKESMLYTSTCFDLDCWFVVLLTFNECLFKEWVLGFKSLQN